MAKKNPLEIKPPGPIFKYPPLITPPKEPTIIDFIADWGKGFWSGMATNLTKGLLDAAGVSEAEVRAYTDAVLKDAEKQAIPTPAIKTAKELKDIWDSMGRASIGVHTLSISLLAGTVLASALPTTSIGDAIDEVWRLPIISAMLSNTFDYHTAVYRYTYAPKIQRFWYANTTPLLPEPYRLAMQRCEGVIDEEKYMEAMAESGFSKEWADAWRDERYEYPSFYDTLALLRRGDINDVIFDRWLTRQAMPSDVREKLKILKEVIPPIQDLRLMAVREAVPNLTYKEIWEWYEKWAGKMGISKEFAEYYRRAAWMRMDVHEAIRYFLWYNNLPEQFEQWLRIADIHEDDRSRIAKVSYNPLTIRELGYAYDVGAVTKSDIETARRRGGLTPEDAKKATDALIAYRTEAEREAVRREWLHLYSTGKRTKEQFKAKLVEMGTNPVAVALWLERGDLEKERIAKEPAEPESKIVVASEALWAFEHGVRTEAWARSKLEALGWDKERIDLAIQREKIEIEAKVPVEAPPEYRQLTVTQIRDLYRLEKIVEADVEKRLIQLNYTPEDAKMLAQLLIYQPVEDVVVKPYTDAWSRTLYSMRLMTAEDLYKNYRALDYDEAHAYKLTLATLVDELYPSLVARYRKGWINEEMFTRELIEVGMEAEDALELLDKTVDEFQLERIEKEKDLTKAEILKGFKTMLIDDRQAVGLLEDLGYEIWEAEYILALEVVTAKSDPEGYWEMRRVTEAYKKARGEAYVTVPDELIFLEKALKEKKDELKRAQDAELPDKKIGELVVLCGELETRMRMVIAKLKLL